MIVWCVEMFGCVRSFNQWKRATNVKASTSTVCIGEEVAREESADGDFGRGINFLHCMQSDWQSHFSMNMVLRYCNAREWEYARTPGKIQGV
jgi:hypothetical protein